MQDRYVGDAGDYAKYSLLRALAGPASDSIRLGVLWYLFPDESHNGDGRHIAYLQEPGMALRDPDTHARLAELVRTGRRSVAAVQQGRILPDGTLYHAASVCTRGKPIERAAHRSSWFQDGLRALESVDLIFFDPDNGIQTAALKKSDLKAGKYVFWDEIEAAWQSGKSLVIYNHLNRSAPAAIQTSRLRATFEQRLLGAAVILPLLFRRGACRHLWIVAQPRDGSRLVRRTRAFLGRGWQIDTDAEMPPGG